MFASARLKASPVALPCVPLISTAAKPVAMVCTVDVEFSTASETIAADAAVALGGMLKPVRFPEM